MMESQGTMTSMNEDQELGVAGDWWKACLALLIAFGIAFGYKLIAELVSETVRKMQLEK